MKLAAWVQIMKISASELSAEPAYKLLTGIVVPRPIAWITTMSSTGVVNLAPFSCFTIVSSSPPMIGVNIGRLAGELKDTARNIHESGEFVVHIPDETMIEQIHLSAIEYPAEQSEVELLKLATVKSDAVTTPQLECAPIAMECKLHLSVPLGKTGSEFIIGEILVFHIRDGLCKDNKIDTRKLRPVARLAGPNYGMIGEIVTMNAVSQTPKMDMSQE